ncbi:helix-hairpin-helix domain-containing protein [Kitasatospora sp. NPDC057542]|uniref:helix-hairpin-helix domain-containing protein n=1 Tax=Streptomycetaceae TaxID=2062 RepID=UPI001CC8EEBA|nr:helix-hairpin-helix domain-containing protein [Streptomyces sp. LS1784]
MTTMGLGAAKRDAINETVRLRMAALLPADDDASGGAGGGSPGAVSPSTGERAASATGPPSPAAMPLSAAMPAPANAGGATDPGEAGDPSEVGVRPRFSSFPTLASALALDRRAVAGLVILLLFAVGYAVQHFWLARPETVAVPALAAVAAPSGAEPPVPADTSVAAVSGVGAGGGVGVGGGAGSAVVVDIGGRVHLPGLYTLPGGSRVADALRAAGGPLPETDTRNLNLARVLTDGEQILVGEQAPVPVPAPAPAGGGGSGSGPPGPAAPRPPVSLNRATLEQLDTLPGVGPTLAQRILAYRTSHGSFRSLDQLRQVSGIGARTYAELRPLLTL